MFINDISITTTMAMPKIGAQRLEGYSRGRSLSQKDGNICEGAKKCEHFEKDSSEICVFCIFDESTFLGGTYK